MTTTTNRVRQIPRSLVYAGLGFLILATVVLSSLPANRRWLANPAGQAAQEGVNAIRVRNDMFQYFLYEPSVVRVPAGTTITWTFEDGVGHNVVGEGWSSPVQDAGTYQHTFTEPGVYHYTCTLHENMNGVVQVVE